MEEIGQIYRFINDATIFSGSNDVLCSSSSVENFGDSAQQFQFVGHHLLQFQSAAAAAAAPHPGGGDDHELPPQTDFYDLIKTHISNHPRYPDLVSAHIDCQKVGAPPEMATLLEEIGREKFATSCIDPYQQQQLGIDPELDEFMESYCEILQRYKEELSKPFDEATAFLTTMESQLCNLSNCTDYSSTMITNATTSDYASADEAVATSEEEPSCGDVEASESQESFSGFGQPCNNNNDDIKGMLLRKYSGYFSNLRKEFLKKRKKGKLPKDAKTTLLDWWNNHYRWPYPTEEEKVKLAEITGLDQKQINNWFINQRKRHWKPSEDMRFALMEGVRSSTAAAGGGDGGPPPYFDTGGGGTTAGP